MPAYKEILDGDRPFAAFAALDSPAAHDYRADHPERLPRCCAQNNGSAWSNHFILQNALSARDGAVSSWGGRVDFASHFVALRPATHRRTEKYVFAPRSFRFA